MAFFLLTLPAEGGQAIVGEATGYLVEADSAAQARDMATAQFGADQDWTDASVTAVDITTLSAADYTGWKYKLTIRNPAQGGNEGVIHRVEYTGVASDTVNLIGGELVALLQGAAAAAVIAEDGGVFVDETTEADNATADNLTLFPAVPVAAVDRFNIGSALPFANIKVDVTTVGTGTYTVVWEYWNGTSWAVLSVSGAGDDFKTVGVQPVSWTIPTDWATTTINGQGPFYFVRAETQTGTTTAQPLGRRIHVGNKTDASFSTPTLDAAAIADALGDKSLQLEVTPPGGEGKAMAALVGAITDEGIAAAVLDVALVVPTAIPEVIKLIK